MQARASYREGGDAVWVYGHIGLIGLEAHPSENAHFRFGADDMRPFSMRHHLITGGEPAAGTSIVDDDPGTRETIPGTPKVHKIWDNIF